MMARITTDPGSSPERALQRFREQVLRENQRTLEALALELKTDRAQPFDRQAKGATTPGTPGSLARRPGARGTRQSGPRWPGGISAHGGSTRSAVPPPVG